MSHQPSENHSEESRRPGRTADLLPPEIAAMIRRATEQDSPTARQNHSFNAPETPASQAASDHKYSEKTTTADTLISDSAESPAQNSGEYSEHHETTALYDSACEEKSAEETSGLDMVRLDVRFEFEPVRVARSEYDKLEPGSSIPLKNTADCPINVVLCGKTIARGEIMVHDGRYAVRILEFVG